MTKIYTVSELNQSIKFTLESSYGWLDVEGEISNFRPYSSGHWYFSLKDETSQISCVMWRGRNNYVFFTPQDGIKVRIKGKLSVYETRGNYQIDVAAMKPLGIGELQLAFEKLKEKLSREGLFDEQCKKPIPKIPSTIGIVTSKDGAALRDVISTLRRRFPAAELILAHSSVQGANASSEIADAIKTLNSYKKIDVIIICRGGGSLEDLWAFNEEITARAIFKSKIPIVTGIGHEVDFTIADYVADLRSPTPTAAAELVTPNVSGLIEYIEDFSYNNFEKIKNQIKFYSDSIRNILKSYAFSLPESLLRNKSQKLDFTAYRVQQSFSNYFQATKSRIERSMNVIKNANPKRNLSRGYSIVRQHSKIIMRVKELNKTLETEIEFFDGRIKLDGEK
ncbi:MAG: exodeoxyribonuclease VII large subunit [Ignavibacteria bacterium]|nr:exodeoxyribonuclease VII large subunit [Ignavibacteria bacterium]